MASAPLRILILEDVPMDAELVEYELRRTHIPFDARCVDTRDGFERELDDFRPDLILSDYTLPHFDGMSALSLARERAPTTPFLIVTGSVNEETAVGCMKAGATDYLLKSNLARIGPAIEAALARVESRAEKARAEAALRRSEANLRAIFNTSLQAFVLVARDGTIQALNPTARDWAMRILGREASEGDRIHDFIPEGAASFQAALAGEARSLERCLRGTDGVERWYETTHAPVVDEHGTVIGVCLNARDVSVRKQAEQALRESEARYRDLFDNASDLVCTTTLDGTFLYVNRAWHEAMGFSDEQLAGRRFPDLVHPDSRERYLDVVARAEAGEPIGQVDLILVTAAGMPLTLEGNISCTATDGAGPAPRHLPRRDRAEAGRGAAPAGGADAGRRPARGWRGPRGQQHDDRGHRLQRVPAPEPRARGSAAERGGRDHQGRHPRRRRHPPAARLHPPAVPPPGGAAGERRGAGPREDAAPGARGGPRPGAGAGRRRGRDPRRPRTARAGPGEPHAQRARCDGRTRPGDHHDPGHGARRPLRRAATTASAFRAANTSSSP